VNRRPRPWAPLWSRISYASWNYFQSLPGAENAKFIDAYRKKYGADAAITDPMIHGYLDVYAWKAAVEKAASFDPQAVRKAAGLGAFDAHGHGLLPRTRA
jgi:urea transport system substrate-binding protein